MDAITIRDLLTGGSNLHKYSRRLDPKLRRILFDGAPSVPIPDLQNTLRYIDTAYDFVRDTVADGGVILFVGADQPGETLIAEQAIRVGQPWATTQWPEGLLSDIVARSTALAAGADEDGRYATGADTTVPGREWAARSQGEWRWRARPSALWVTGGLDEAAVVDEARRLGIPVVGISDSGEDSHRFDYPIPGTPASSYSVRLLTRIVADAVQEGHDLRRTRSSRTDHDSVVEETGAWSPLRGRRRQARSDTNAAKDSMSWLDHVVDVDRSPIVQLLSTTAPMSARVEGLLSDRLGVRFWTKNDPDEWVIGSAVVGGGTDAPVVIRVTRGEKDREGFTIELVDPTGESALRAEVLRRFEVVSATLTLWSLGDTP